MDQSEFEDLVYDMWYPESGRREKARAKYKDLNPQVRHSGLLRILQSDQDGMIWRAVNLLLNEDNDKFLPFVLPLFESSNPNVRYATAFAFASWGFSGAIEPLPVYPPRTSRSRRARTRSNLRAVRRTFSPISGAITARR